MTNPMSKLYAPDTYTRWAKGPAAQEIRANRADVARELRGLVVVIDGADYRQAVEAMAVALYECAEEWSHFGSASPSSHDFVYVMGRAVGIGTEFSSIDEGLIDAFDEFAQEGATAVELAVWLHARLFGA